MTLQDLIARLEAATGPDRELDVKIIEAINPGSRWEPYSPKARIKWLMDESGQRTICYGKDRIPNYTTSIDAALTLVPEGMGWEVGFGRYVPHIGTVWTGKGKCVGECDSNRAIALCIAALKARLP